jgi:hypothetical protein
MTKLLNYTLLLTILAFAFVSCKKTGNPTACFNISNPTIKKGDFIYFMNCSEYYAVNKWTVTEVWPATLQSSIKNHYAFLPADSGSFTVLLEVTNYGFKDTSRLTKTFTVIP